MTKKQDTDSQDDSTLEDEDLEDTKDSEDQATDDSSQTAADDAQDDTPIDWEARYTGLQKVVSKRETALATQRKKLDKLVADKEEADAQSSTSSKTASDLEGDLKEAKEKLAEIQGERDTLDKQLLQQGIVMKDFPTISGLADYIPPAEDEEQFRTNAKNFKAALDAYVEKGVDQALKGASPPGPTDTDEVPAESEVDQLYTTMYATAGVEGKEKEYKEARDKLDRLDAAKEKQQDI